MTQNQPNRLDRIEATQAVHSQILNELALAHRELAEFSTRQAQRQQQQLDRYDEVLSRLENSVNRQQETLSRIERSIEVLTTSTTETIQLVAQQAIQSERDRQACLSEIREIWRYLRYEPRNGNGRSEE
ncbi:hypothetical protein ACE1AT_21705 [Pelatocladus sp. BLCC-F211]|uniref:hypothetical protein n=1 Tax=Pelatocladus sp. BLCC-F211 TaxID=3342752 RepID=UPI0035BB9A4F